MRRREFVAIVSGATAVWPLFARGQHNERVRRVGYLSALAESDLEVQSLIGVLLQRLQELGWTNGGNVQFGFRFGDADAPHTWLLAPELVELRPAVVFAAGAPAAIPFGNKLSPSRLFLCKLWIRSLLALSPTWHDRRAISPASPI